MDAIEILTGQHRDVEALFARVRSSEEPSERREICDALADVLAAHTEIEETTFYPEAYARRTAERLREAVEEHLAMKRLLADLIRMQPSDAQFDAKLQVLEEQVRHHVEEEESSLFPSVRKELGADRLREMGRTLQSSFDDILDSEPRLKVPAQTDEAAPLS
jgi:hemerythrin superfamily protein